MDYFGVALIRTLPQDHVNKLSDDVDIRILQIPLLQCAHSACSSRSVSDGIPGGFGLLQQVAADRVQATWIGEGCQLDRAKLRSVGLAGERRRYNSILGDRNVGCVRRD